MMRRVRWWRQLRVRLMIGVTLLIVCSTTSIDYAVQRVLSRELPQVELQAMTLQTKRLRAALERSYAEHGTLSIKLLDQMPHLPVRIYDAGGTVLETSSGMAPLRSTPAITQALNNQEHAATIVLEGERRYGSYVLPVRRGEDVVGALEVAEELPAIEQFQTAIHEDLITITMMALAGMVAFWVYLSARFGQAVDEIKQQTAAIVGGNFQRRIAVTSDDEIGQIALHLNQMAEGLQRLARTRNEFLGKVSHELRTPLTIAQGFTSTLRQGPLLPKQERTISVIDDQLNDLGRLVNDLLELARSQDERMHLHTEVLDCARLVTDAVTHHQPIVGQHQLTLHAQVPRTSLLVMGDRLRLQQVLSNLINNASRYSQRCIRLELDAEAQNVVLRVHDDGPGIAPEDAQHIFEPFCQLGTGARGRVGLGLTIVRELVLAHGGTIAVEQRHTGACFAIRLPRVAADAQHEPCVAVHEQRDGATSRIATPSL